MPYFSVLTVSNCELLITIENDVQQLGEDWRVNVVNVLISGLINEIALLNGGK